jgi:hypothetical protein
MYDHHALSHRSTGHVLECQRNSLPGYGSRDIRALALHGLNNSRGVGAVGIRSEEYWVTFLDGPAVEKAVYDGADIRHRPYVSHRKLFECTGSRNRGKCGQG